MNIAFIDLAAQQTRIKKSLESRIAKVLEHGQYIQGPEVKELEGVLEQYTGAKYCVSCSSGTDALLMAMMALGLKAGDEVITTPFTFFATAEVMVLLGVTPVFVDIDPHTFNLDAALVEQAITKKTKAIVPVSLYGQCADFNAFNEIGKKHGIHIIEDAAQSFGSSYHKQKSCSLSEIACTSFFPAKPLGCYGDGGAVFTNDPGLLQPLKEIREHGMPVRYHHTRLGINGRFDTIQAAILLAKMEIFEDEMQLRQKVAQGYKEVLGDLVQAGKLGVPQIREGNISAYAQYTVTVSNREKVMEALKGLGVPVAVHYPRTLDEQPALSGLYKVSCARNLAHAKRAASTVMSLPFHPYLEKSTQVVIADALAKVL